MVVVGEVHGERDLVKVVELERLHALADRAAGLDGDRRLSVTVAVLVAEVSPVVRPWNARIPLKIRLGEAVVY